MDWLYLLPVVIGAIVTLAVLRRGKARLRPEILYDKRRSLFTAAERSFLGVLDQATADRYRVFAKVRVADVLTPATNDRSQRTSLFNRISAKHFDFVLCDPRSLDIRLVVELHDRSHRSKARSERDKLLQDACVNAGLVLIEVPARRGYSLKAVRRMLNDAEASIRAAPDAQGRIEPTI